MAMTVGEFAGYLASLLVFVTFYMKTMVPLRIVGILSNLVFLTYALIEHLVPILILHGALLPLNLRRLYEILKLVGEIRDARTGDLALDRLLPFMTRRPFTAGETLFRKGDLSHEMFYVREGVIRLEEIGKTIGESDMLGEISMFSPSGKRTATAVCETDGELLRMSDDQVLRLYHQNPSFGFYIVRLITRRLIENYETFAAEQKPLEMGLRARNPSADPPYPSGDRRPVPAPPPRPVRRTRGKAIYRLAGWGVAAAALVAYAGWWLAPYVTSVLFRDAAVTTWINVATSPIRGNLEGRRPRLARRWALTVGSLWCATCRRIPPRWSARRPKSRALKPKWPSSRPVSPACRISTRSGGRAPPTMPIHSNATSISTSRVRSRSLPMSASG
jgi:CRP/FNR family cyclic AMP-dependent transcriptional regulator